MTSKWRRRWSEWPGRTLRELNASSGVAGIGGIAMGLTFLTGAAALAATGAGAVLVVGSVGYAVIKGFPEASINPADLVGRVVTLDELRNVFPPIPKLSIVGITQAGKTTLKDRLSFQYSAQPNRTQKVEALVVSLQTSPPRFVAVLDGGGERTAQQFMISEACDFLCIVIDHNISHTESKIDDSRLRDHREMMNQVRIYFDEHNVDEKRWIRLLVNKRDLWSASLQDEQNKFEQFCASELSEWQKGRRAKIVDNQLHSNNIVEDLSTFMTALKRQSEIFGG